MNRSLCLAVAVLGPLSQPGSPAADPLPTPDAITRAVRDLAADDYRTRETATAWLWAAGPAAEDALKAGLKSPDAEVVARCRDLLDKIPYGITPDMPKRFVELIATARAGGPGAWPGVAPDLLDLGPRGLEVAQKLIDRLASTAGQRDAMLRTLDLEGWRVASAFLAAGRADRAADLLERSAVAVVSTWREVDTVPVAVRHYAAFLAGRGQLTGQLSRWKKLAEKHAGQSGDSNGRMPDGDPDGKVSQVVLVHLARLSGDLATARKAADESGRVELKEAVLFDQAAWADLAELPVSGNRLPGTVPGLKAMYLTAAGKTTEAEAAVAELKKVPIARTSVVVPPLVFRALMYAGRPTDALAALAKDESAATPVMFFEILCQQHRYDEAFPHLDRAVGERTLTRWQSDAARLRVYHQRGQVEKYRETIAPLAAYDRVTAAESAAAQDLIEQLVGVNRTDDALPIAAGLLNGGTAPADVFGKLYPKAPLAAETWWRYLRLKHPTDSMRTTVARLPPLVDKRLADKAGRAALADAATVARSQPDADADRWLQGLAEACQSAGLADEARAYCKEAAERSKSAAAYLRLGDLHAEAKQYAAAAAAYEQSWRAETKQPLPLWLRGWALEKAGQPGGSEARDLAHALPLGDDDARLKLAEELAKRSAFGPELMAAARDERRLVLKLNGPGASFARNAEGVLSSDPGSAPDKLAAADTTRRFLIRMLRSNAFFKRNQGYLVVLHREAVSRAQGLLATGDVAGAIRAAETALGYLPGQPEPAAVVVPELVKKGHAAEADRIYAATVAVQDRLCKDYPESAEFRNSRAWTAVRCGRDLDIALEHSHKAVALSPTSAGYRETLAEVLFQRGDKAAAVAEITRCVDLEPKAAYYDKQRQRMEAGDRAAPLPER